MGYRHFTIEERESILSFLSQGITQTEMAKNLNRNKGSISRELRRNVIYGKYSPSFAQNMYAERKSRCGAKNILECDKNLKSEIKEHLENKMSPESISGRMKLEKKETVSFSTIYRGIKTGILGVTEKEVLVRKGKVKPRNTEETRGKISDRKGIEERPAEANERTEIGHFELDTVIGKRKTFTSDNGKEFARFKDYEEVLGMPNYFANPYHSWERGTNEQTNGILRRYFPKGTDFSSLTKSVVDEVIIRINLMPKKCLGWLTPFEVFWKKSLQLT